jgi:hypothetical protein
MTMDKRTTGIIATAVTAFLCGLPGCCLFIFGAATAAGVMPYNTEFNGVTSSGTIDPTVGYGLLCLAIIFIVIPFAVGFFTLLKKPAAASAAVIDIDEPLPPAS